MQTDTGGGWPRHFHYHEATPGSVTMASGRGQAVRHIYGGVRGQIMAADKFGAFFERHSARKRIARQSHESACDA